MVSAGGGGYDGGGGGGGWGGRRLKGRRIDTSMTDAHGSIVQPDYVIKRWRVTNGISLIEGEGSGEWRWWVAWGMSIWGEKFACSNPDNATCDMVGASWWKLRWKGGVATSWLTTAAAAGWTRLIDSFIHWPTPANGSLPIDLE